MKLNCEKVFFDFGQGHGHGHGQGNELCKMSTIGEEKPLFKYVSVYARSS